MRPIFLVLQDLIAALSVPLVARLTGVSQGMVRKWCEDPERSGKAIALTHLLKLMAHAAELQVPLVQTLIDELVNFFVPQNRLLVRKDLITHILADIEALRTGRPPALPPMETVLLCDRCQQPLQIFASSTGRIKYDCAGCR